MAVSQNGYSANDRSAIISYTVTKAGRKMALRKGPAGEMLADFFLWFDENIRDIDPGVLDEWGYAERPIRGSTTVLSNHASGTAGDVDATKWPLGALPGVYLSAAEIAKVRAKLREYRGCIRWGGDYTGRKDPMHFEINEDEATVAVVWAAVKAARVGGSKEDDMPDPKDLWDYELHHAGDEPAGNVLGGAFRRLKTMEDNTLPAIMKALSELKAAVAKLQPPGS